MSKILGESLPGEAAKMYWKRFVASVTGFADKYRYEPYFQTEINVLGLQILFGLLILAIVAVSFFSLYEDITFVLVQSIQETVSSQMPPASIGANVASELERLGEQNVGLLVISIIAATICFSYVVARITLIPVRNALESQKRFIGNIAHELRTPLATIKTNTEVRLLDPDVPKEAREMHESNLEELDRISDIINNLLSLNASVRPERIEFKNVDLGVVVRTVVDKLHSLTTRKYLEVTVRLGEWRIVYGNVSALEQIVMNIMKNAIRFTPAHGHISATVEGLGPGAVELSIQDSGSGIPRKDLFHIFEPFYRADSSRNRTGGVGSGLGLTIVSELVKLHNGKITVRSTESRGTTVVVRLPSGLKDEQASEQKEVDASEVAVDFSDGNGKA